MTDASGPWSQAQQEALDKAYELLGEHFDSAVVIVESDRSEDGDERQNDRKQCIYHGGWSTGLGLVTWAVEAFLGPNDDE